MSFNERLHEIRQYIKKLHQLEADMRSAGRASRIEVDLLREHLRSVYDLCDDLTGASAPEASVSNPEMTAYSPHSKAHTPPVVEPEEPSLQKEDRMVPSAHEETPTPEPEGIPPAIPHPPVMIEDRHVAESPARDQHWEEDHGAPQEKKEEPKPSSPAQEPTPSLFERLQKSSGREVNQKNAAGRSLKELIPLNDKFMFIREFFDNSLAKYEEALGEIEKTGAREAAVRFMEEKVWTSEIREKQAELIERFRSVIDRKFGD